MKGRDGLCFAAFVTPHGFGHAARAASVMEAVAGMRQGVRWEIFTTIPAWFFRASLSCPFGYHAFTTDVGLFQTDPFTWDRTRTLEALDAFLPMDGAGVEALAALVETKGCRLVLCDIAALGIRVAQKAAMPSVLLENFTWDWIYEGYFAVCPELLPFARCLERLYPEATLHIQTDPLCRPVVGALRVGPVSRPGRMAPAKVREALGIPREARMVLVTSGGIPAALDLNGWGQGRGDIFFCIAGAPRGGGGRQGRLRFVPHDSDIPHPDLIRSSDGVVGKLGYSTLAEVYHAGVPFGYVPRPGFRESEVLGAFVQEEMLGMEIPQEEFLAGEWRDRVEDLLSLGRFDPQRRNGAEEAAEALLALVDKAEPPGVPKVHRVTHGEKSPVFPSENSGGLQ